MPIEFTPNDSSTIIITLMGRTFVLFEGHCDGQNGLRTHLTRERNICYGDGDGVTWCERTIKSRDVDSTFYH